MGLAEHFAAALGGKPIPPITVALVNQRSQVGERVPARQWGVQGVTASTDVRFGPFPGPVRYDGVGIFVDGVLAEVVHIGDSMTPGGVGVDVTVSVAVA